ncbi:hypothetical protein [Aeromicrobium sp.]|jgi:hypothetical protein|uniref:hypothetical protein n=1 Tax=Aeromicrobium sp. TaxID=1871063 RepID=UPI003C5E56E1
MALGTEDLSVLDAMPLAHLDDLARACGAARDLVDEHVAAAVARAREAGIPWGTIAAVLRGD